MTDRVPTYPGRVRLTPVAGQENVYDLTLADDAIEQGTPLNKANLLTDATAALLGLATSDATVNKSFEKLAAENAKDFTWIKITTSQVWTAPNAKKSLFRVYAVGGGGGGGGRETNGRGSGGGGGYIEIGTFEIPAGTNVEILCGAGGAGSTDDSGGGDGGATSFGAYLTANGGKGGQTAVSAPADGGDGGAGGGGARAYYSGATTYGRGGNGSFGGGGGASDPSGDGGNGGVYGGNGGGANHPTEDGRQFFLSDMLLLGDVEHKLNTSGKGGENRSSSYITAGSGGYGGIGGHAYSDGCGGGGGLMGNGGNATVSDYGGGGGGFCGNGGNCSRNTASSTSGAGGGGGLFADGGDGDGGNGGGGAGIEDGDYATEYKGGNGGTGGVIITFFTADEVNDT